MTENFDTTAISYDKSYLEEDNLPSLNKKPLGDGFYFMSLEDLNEDPNDYSEDIACDMENYGIIFKEDGTELTDVIYSLQWMTGFTDTCNYLSLSSPDTSIRSIVLNKQGEEVMICDGCDYPYFHHNVISVKERYYNTKGELIIEGKCVAKVNEKMFIKQGYIDNEKIFIIDANTCEIIKTYV